MPSSNKSLVNWDYFFNSTQILSNRMQALIAIEMNIKLGTLNSFEEQGETQDTWKGKYDTFQSSSFQVRPHSLWSIRKYECEKAFVVKGRLAYNLVWIAKSQLWRSWTVLHTRKFGGIPVNSKQWISEWGQFPPTRL